MKEATSLGILDQVIRRKRLELHHDAPPSTEYRNLLGRSLTNHTRPVTPTAIAGATLEQWQSRAGLGNSQPTTPSH